MRTLIKISLLILALPLLIFAGYSIAQDIIVVTGQPRGAAAPSYCTNTGDIYTQSMEGTAVDGQWAANGDWSDESSASISGGADCDGNYEATVRAGSQSANCYGDSDYDDAMVTGTQDAGAETEYYTRMWIYMVSATNLDDGEYWVLLWFNDNAGSNNRLWQHYIGQNSSNLQVWLRYYDATNFEQDAFGHTTISYTTWVNVESHCKDGAAGTGNAEFWVNGVEQFDAIEDNDPDVAIDCNLVASATYKWGIEHTAGAKYGSILIDCVDVATTRLGD